MADLSLVWKDDLDLDPGGDLAVVDGPEQTKQHIIRRLFTAVRGYLWTKSYGLGLLQRIGNVAKPAKIEAIVRAGMKLEKTVATLPVPDVRVTKSTLNNGLFYIAIRYHDAATGQPVALQFEVPTS